MEMNERHSSARQMFAKGTEAMLTNKPDNAADKQG